MSQPSRLAAGIGAALPLLCLVVAFGVLVVAGHGPGGLLMMLQEAGAPGFLVVASAVLAAVGGGVLVALAGLGYRVPSAATVAVAALPWILGATGMMLGLSRASEAVSFAAPEQRASLMAAGLAEAANARFLGSVLGGALLAGTAMGLGTCAL